MNSRIYPVLALLVLLGAFSFAQDDVKIAEGSYEDYDSWTLWQTSDGYKVQTAINFDGVPSGAQLKELLILEKTCNMTSMRYEASNWSVANNGVLDCSVKKDVLECKSSFDKHEGIGKIPASGDFAVQFGVHVSLLDSAWFYSSLVCNLPNDPNESNTLGIFALALAEPPRYVMARPYDATIKYLGSDRFSLFGKMVTLWKYDVSAGPYSANVWTTEKRFVIFIATPGYKLQLTRFKQYRELIPELPVNVELKRFPSRNFTNTP